MARNSQGDSTGNHRVITFGVVSTFGILIVFSYFISTVTVDVLKSKPAVKSVAEFFAEFPIRFQDNTGSFAHDVKFFSKGYQYDLLFLNNEVLLNLYSNEKVAQQPSDSPQNHTTRLAQIALEFVGANRLPDIKGLGSVLMTPVSSSGDATATIENFTEVKYTDVYPGVDVYFFGKQKQLFYEFVLSESADISSLKMKVGSFEGVGTMNVDLHGNITVTCHGKKMTINRPQVYRLRQQQKQPVEGYFFVTRDNEIRFKEVTRHEMT